VLTGASWSSLIALLPTWRRHREQYLDEGDSASEQNAQCVGASVVTAVATPVATPAR
jgi:hypothetical protein